MFDTYVSVRGQILRTIGKRAFFMAVRCGIFRELVNERRHNRGVHSPVQTLHARGMTKP
jgi:hypothetical protein